MRLPKQVSSLDSRTFAAVMFGYYVARVQEGMYGAKFNALAHIRALHLANARSYARKAREHFAKFAAVALVFGTGVEVMDSAGLAWYAWPLDSWQLFDLLGMTF